jgi:hypothetical protein
VNYLTKAEQGMGQTTHLQWQARSSRKYIFLRLVFGCILGNGRRNQWRVRVELDIEGKSKPQEEERVDSEEGEDGSAHDESPVEHGGETAPGEEVADEEADVDAAKDGEEAGQVAALLKGQ